MTSRLNYRRLLHDLAQTLTPLALGIVVIVAGRWMARLLGLPDLAIAGSLGGIALASLGPLRFMRRILFPNVDLMALFRRAYELDPGRVWQGVCIVIAALVLALSGAAARAQSVPANAALYLPVLVDEQRSHWPGMPMPSALAAQVEQETCISLKHPRCWSPRAQLKTSREQGVGLGQITRAFRADGSTRFDSLAELRSQYRQQLAGWAWETDALYDPRYQLRAMILMDLRNWQAVEGASVPHERLAMALAAYNGGLRGLANDRARCDATPGCDAGRWFGHVAETCTKSQAAAAGYRLSWCQINREYPHNILGPRRAKYLQLLGA